MSGPNDPNNPGSPQQWQQGQQPGPWGQPTQGPPPGQGWGQQPQQQYPPQPNPGQQGPGQYQPPSYPQQGGHYGQPQGQPGNYGQPQGQQPGYGQPQGQYGQSGPYGQPGQYGQPGPGGSDQFSAMAQPKSGKKLPLIIGASVVALIAVILAVTAFLAPGFAVTKVLSQEAAQEGVKTVLENDYQAEGVENVKCPKDKEIKKGDSFTCTVTVSGANQQVKITFLDDDGKYEVGQPTAG